MKKRGIELVARKVTFATEEDEDLKYWNNMTIKQRLTQMFEWNAKVWETINLKKPSKIEYFGGKQIKNKTDQDDF